MMTPNWIHLTNEDAPNDNNAASLQNNDTIDTTTTTITNSEEDVDSRSNKNKPITYSTPHETSRAYQNGLLKSDDNISSNNSRIRLAFRYVKEEALDAAAEEEEDVQSSIKNNDVKIIDVQNEDNIKEQEQEEEDEEVLYLCWINQRGIPFHFRPIHPITSTTTTTKKQQQQLNNNDTTTFQQNQLVDTNDHIEHTFPGHAFIFCRRCRRCIDVAKAEKVSGENEVDGGKGICIIASNDDDDVRVVDGQDGLVYFVRRCTPHQKSEEEVNDDYSDDNDTNNNNDECDVQWESFVLVGGYRPDCSSFDNISEKEEVEENGDSTAAEDDVIDVDKRNQDSNMNAEDTVDEEESDNESTAKGDKDGSDDDDSSISSCDDRGSEHQVQLLTITQQQKLIIPPTTACCDSNLTNNITTTTRNNEEADNNIDNDNDDDEEEDVDLPSNVLGCSDCIPQSVPFLRDAMNPKPRHTPAFVVSTVAAATGGDNNNNNTTSLLELPAATQTQSNSTYQKNINDSKSTAITNEITLKVSVRMARLDPTPIDTSSKYYDDVMLGGWPCRVEPGCFSSSTDNDDNDQCSSNNNNDNIISSLRSRFESDILAASNALPKLARDKLMASTPIWINKSQCYGPKVAPITGRDGCFHPGSKWLKRNGMNPAKCGGVEWYDARHYLSDCDLWGPGGLMLHELSHAWHCLHIKNGYDNEEIISVYKKAMEEKL